MLGPASSATSNESCPARQAGDTLFKTIKVWKATAGQRRWTAPASLFMAAAVRRLAPGSPPDVLDVPAVPAVAFRWLGTQGIVALLEARLNVADHEDHPDYAPVRIGVREEPISNEDAPVLIPSCIVGDAPVPTEDPTEDPPALPKKPVIVNQPVSLAFQHTADQQVQVKEPVGAQNLPTVMQDEEQPSPLQRLLQRLRVHLVWCFLDRSLLLLWSRLRFDLVPGLRWLVLLSALLVASLLIDHLFAPLIKKRDDTDELAVVEMVDVPEDKVKNKGKGFTNESVIQECTLNSAYPPSTRKKPSSAAAQSGPRTSTPAHSHGVIRGTGSGMLVSSAGSSAGSSGSRSLGAPSYTSGSLVDSSVNVAMPPAPASRAPIKKALHKLALMPDAAVQCQPLIAQCRKAKKPKRRKKSSGAQCQQEEHPIRSGSPSSVIID
ncbi:uncharacterized protein LAESUDRAFT_716250 [Laetiporus sulphureus 93-53]|uniref:Uncharacterized protein n=1 Tax=Laetiporus sulphureus 93-53 TaxID=1314785 RepID=A0A165CU39_9APHY|nr:uncharacterized protein LAESUDRAFT_716250 [Laetiporus sulphureus 93-53]KZT03436.1 hypothetical protein LAESUDRAFT_716250 [Laetiporus sulphureus 93-53]